MKANPMHDSPSATEKKEQIRYKRDANGQYLCHLCDYTAKYGSTLHYHLKKKHTGNCPHVCKTCGYTFLHKIALETHVASRHPEVKTNVEMFRCSHEGCHYESLTLGNLEIHRARKHYADVVQKNLELIDDSNKKIYKCLCCQRDYKSSSAFHYHIVKELETHSLTS
jgi:ribosomal protein L37AE/L43A